jgi:hypothetical protein
LYESQSIGHDKDQIRRELHFREGAMGRQRQERQRDAWIVPQFGDSGKFSAQSLLGHLPYTPAFSPASGPSVDRTPKEIGDAVRLCLAKISRGGTPLGVIAEFIADLKELGWDELSIRRVDASVRQLLRGIVGPDEEQIC